MLAGGRLESLKKGIRIKSAGSLIAIVIVGEAIDFFTVCNECACDGSYLI